MTNTNFTKTAEGIVQERNDRYAKVFQPLTLITLVFFWAGYFYSLYNGNSNNISSYPFLIIAFSILNAPSFIYEGEGGKWRFRHSGKV